MWKSCKTFSAKAENAVIDEARIHIHLDMWYVTEPVDCEDCKWNVEAIRFTEFEDYIVKFKSAIEGSFVYKKNGKKYRAEIHSGNLSIKEYEVTWKDICIAMKNAGIKDNNIIRKVHDELNVY